MTKDGVKTFLEKIIKLSKANEDMLEYEDFEAVESVNRVYKLILAAKSPQIDNAFRTSLTNILSTAMAELYLVHVLATTLVAHIEEVSRDSLLPSFLVVDGGPSNMYPIKILQRHKAIIAKSAIASVYSGKHSVLNQDTAIEIDNKCGHIDEAVRILSNAVANQEKSCDSF